MPIDYKKYPSNWKTEIRPSILERSNNCCEFCGIPNYSIGLRSKDGAFITEAQIDNSLDDNGYDYFKNELSNHVAKNGYVCVKLTKIILTIAHLDHDITNNCPTNLKALCQKCHLSYDKDHHRKNARQTLKTKKGLLELAF